MTTDVAVSPVDQVLITVRRSRMLLIALHFPMIAFLISIGATGLGFVPVAYPAFALPAGLVIGTLQIRHSLAFAAGRRPRYAVQSFSAIVLLAVVPVLELDVAWYPSLWFVGASGAMLARRRLRPLILVAVAAVWVALALRDWVGHPSTFNEVASLVAYIFALGLMGSAAIYGSARLVRVVDDLFDARAQLAELAIGAERSRVARDLHDVLGQSLTALSLKGELAVRLLTSDAQRARQELTDLTTLASEALVDVRSVALDQRPVSLTRETSRSTALLRTAGIDAHVHVAVDRLCPDDRVGARLGRARRSRQRASPQRRLPMRHQDLPQRSRRQAGDRQRRRGRTDGTGQRTRRSGGPGRRSRRKFARRTHRRRLVPVARGRAGQATVIRVLIAEDAHLVRGALVALISLEPDLEVVAEVDRGDDVLAAVGSSQADVALLDIDLPGVDGLTAAQQLHEQIPTCRTLVVTGLSQPGHLLRALQAHVRGFMLKDAPADKLADAIRRVAAGERVLDPDLVAAALETGTSPLTAREADVLHLSETGVSTEQIAATLYLSPATVRNYLSNAIAKLNARSRIDAIRIARQAGWL